ncbi:metallopeptidase TldD-related protein [Myxococcota bacterium]|nr:metallopeptidase TldD-related protein [Myxococcota bacterium]
MSSPEPMEIVDRAIAAALAAGASGADCALVESDSTEARVRGEEIEFVKQALERTLAIRALVAGDGGAGSAVTSTSDLSPEAVERMATETVKLAKATAKDPAADIPEEGFATNWPDLELIDASDRNVSVEERIETALRAEAAARSTDTRIGNSEGSQVGSEFSSVALGNHAGFRGEYRSASHSLVSEPVAQENGSMQRDYWYTAGRKLSDLESPEAVGRKAAERALRRLGGRRIETCEAPVIFDPFTSPSLLHHLVGCLNGYAIYREGSFLAGRLGETIASDQVTIIDDGRIVGGLGSRPFDGEGQPTRRNIVLDRGRMETYLLDSYSARKLGMQTTGNATRGLRSSPTVGITNLWLEPGQGDLAEIVAQTDRGLLVTELIGMGFNPVTGDYSRGAAGMWIENGEITHPVEEVTIAGNFGDMLLGIDAVGSDLEWRGSVAAPSLRISQMTIAGD